MEAPERKWMTKSIVIDGVEFVPRQEARREALEEAARVAESAPYNRKGMICGCSEGLAEFTRDAIRALDTGERDSGHGVDDYLKAIAASSDEKHKTQRAAIARDHTLNLDTEE